MRGNKEKEIEIEIEENEVFMGSTHYRVQVLQ
jgi:hypothetical protein